MGRGSNGYTKLDTQKFPPLQGFRVSYVTASNNALYGIYAFDAQHGVIEQSYASGSADSGFYVGQCKPCDIVVRGNVAERNAVGYEGTNASGRDVRAGQQVQRQPGRHDLELRLPGGVRAAGGRRVRRQPRLRQRRGALARAGRRGVRARCRHRGRHPEPAVPQPDHRQPRYRHRAGLQRGPGAAGQPLRGQRDHAQRPGRRCTRPRNARPAGATASTTAAASPASATRCRDPRHRAESRSTRSPRRLPSRTCRASCRTGRRTSRSTRFRPKTCSPTVRRCAREEDDSVAGVGADRVQLDAGPAVVVRVRGRTSGAGAVLELHDRGLRVHRVRAVTRRQAGAGRPGRLREPPRVRGNAHGRP